MKSDKDITNFNHPIGKFLFSQVIVLAEEVRVIYTERMLELSRSGRPKI